MSQFPEYEAVQAALQDIATEVDRRIQEATGSPQAFTVLVWTQPTAYVSNANRDAVYQALKRWCALYEAGMHLPDNTTFQ